MYTSNACIKNPHSDSVKMVLQLLPRRNPLAHVLSLQFSRLLLLIIYLFFSFEFNKLFKNHRLPFLFCNFFIFEWKPTASACNGTERRVDLPVSLSPSFSSSPSLSLAPVEWKTTIENDKDKYVKWNKEEQKSFMVNFLCIKWKSRCSPPRFTMLLLLFLLLPHHLLFLHLIVVIFPLNQWRHIILSEFKPKLDPIVTEFFLLLFFL